MLELTGLGVSATPGRMVDVSRYKQIGRRLARAREALGLSQVDFCRAAGIAANTYNQYEKGVSRPELDKGLAICRAHGLTLDYIYRGDVSGLPIRIAGKLVSDADAAE